MSKHVPLIEARDLVKGRKLKISLVEAEALFLVKIQGILDAGDHDSTDRLLWTQAVYAVRELGDLRGRKTETPREKLFRRMKEINKEHNL